MAKQFNKKKKFEKKSRNVCEVSRKALPLHPHSGNNVFQVANNGTLAQVVEQWTENPCVLGSTPRGTTSSIECK